VLLTGATGNLGREAVNRIAEKADALRLRVFVRPEERSLPFVKNVVRGGLAEIHWGDLRDARSVTEAVRDADIVLHAAALVSPLADRTPPEIVDAVNVGGTQNIVEAIRASGRQDDSRLVYVGSVAQTGGRNPPIHWGRAGDPIKISRNDHYALTKARAEAVVAESGLRHWVSLRQGGILHFELWKIFDPIIFHNPINGVFEWSTADDSGRLMAGVCSDEVPASFWRGFYNVGGGAACRAVNHQFLERSLPNYRDILRPHWFATRNFHGQWFSDSDRLEALVPFREQSFADYFEQAPRHMPLLNRLAPRFLPGLTRRRIEALAKGPGGTLHWLEHDERDKIAAYFGSREAWEAIAHSWDDFPLASPDRSWFCSTTAMTTTAPPRR
jgi:nucleoside-diphosphate-sugar epimerase